MLVAIGLQYPKTGLDEKCRGEGRGGVVFVVRCMVVSVCLSCRDVVCDERRVLLAIC